MDEARLFELMVDLHRGGARQGPGSNEETLRALALTRLDPQAPLAVADIGCGTGASTLALARALPRAQFTAVDLFDAFLDILMERSRSAGLAERIRPMSASMDALSLEPGSLDLIWSEGAVYNMGFQAGIAAWRPLLKPGGVLAVSEITWLRPDPPEPIRAHWEGEYPEIAPAGEKIRVLENQGYDLLGYLTLPPAAWITNYYEPTAGRLPAFLAAHPDEPEAAELVAMEQEEAELYRRYQDWFSYGFYVARRRDVTEA